MQLISKRAPPRRVQADMLRVDVECSSPLSFGQTVCDLRRTSGRPPNCRVCRRMDVAAFWQLMLAALAAADAASPMGSGRGSLPAATAATTSSSSSSSSGGGSSSQQQESSSE